MTIFYPYFIILTLLPGRNLTQFVGMILNDVAFWAWVWQKLCDHAGDLGLLFVGFLGCCVAVATGRQKGEDQPPARIFSIFITGEVLCTTTSKALVSTWHVDPSYTVPVGFVVAIMGMRIIDQIMRADLGAILAKLFPAIFSTPEGK